MALMSITAFYIINLKSSSPTGVHYTVYLCKFLLNLQVYGFSDVIQDEMVHLERVLGFTGILANIGHGVILDVLLRESLVLWNEVTVFSVRIIYHHYVGPYFHPSLFLGSI